MNGDLPRDELMKRAQAFLDEAPPGSLVYFKFDCELCGRRCELAEAGKLYQTGECDRCGHVTAIATGGFSVHLNLTGRRGPEMQKWTDGGATEG